MRGACGLALLLAVGAPVPGTAQARPTQAAPARMTDAQAADLAKEALRAEDPASIRAALARLKRHTFKSSRVPERELVLYAQGVLEARLGNLRGATVPLKKLERQWPSSPLMGEVQTILADDALRRKRYKEAEGRLHRALGADMPSERKRKAQELMLWALVEQGRPQEGLPIVQSLRPLEAGEKPSERGLAAIVEVLQAAGDRTQLEGSRNAFLNLYPASPLKPRVDLAYGRLLGRGGDPKAGAEVFQKLIQDHPSAVEADEARLALASLLTDGSLPDAKGLPSAESLLAEVRRGGKAWPKGAAQLVELRLLVGKSRWTEALDLVDRLDGATRQGQPEIWRLWRQAWQAWVRERLEKAAPGDLLGRLKPGTFIALEARDRLGVAELFATHGLLEALPPLIAEAPAKERPALRRAALAKAQPEAQGIGVLKLLPARGGTPEEALSRARANAALGRWPALRKDLEVARPCAERVGALLRLLQRPLATGETASLRRKDAEGWLARAREQGAAREPLAILVADLRWQVGDVRGALALYPERPVSADQRGWVALMRAQALLKLGQREAAGAALRGARDEAGFKAQRDALAGSLRVY